MIAHGLKLFIAKERNGHLYFHDGNLPKVVINKGIIVEIIKNDTSLLQDVFTLRGELSQPILLGWRVPADFSIQIK
jgi:hypothetical protein